MKNWFFSLFVCLIAFTIISNRMQGQNQYSFGDTYVHGIKVIIDQEQKKVPNPQNEVLSKYKDARISGTGLNNVNTRNMELKKASEDKVSINNSKINSQIKDKNIGLVTRPSLEQDLQNKVGNGPAYVSKSKPLKKSKTRANGIAFNAPDLFTEGFLMQYVFTPEVRNQVSQYLLQSIRSVMDKQLKTRMKDDEYGTHSRTNLQFANNIQIKTSYFAHASSPSITIHLSIPHNRFFAQIMTPYTTSNTDPNFAITFDVNLMIPISLPTSTNQTSVLPQMGDIQVDLTNISEPTSNNIISQLGFFIVRSNLLTLFGAPDIMAVLRQNRRFVFSSAKFNQQIAKIKDSFSGLPAMRIENYLEGNTVVLRATNKEETPIYLH